MKESYKVKIKQFCNKYKNPTEQILDSTRKRFRADKLHLSVKECYEAFVERVSAEELKDPTNPPSWTSWKYVVYFKESYKEYFKK